MRIPKVGYIRHRILLAIHEKGAMTIDQIIAAVPDANRDAIFSLSSAYSLVVENGTYALPTNLRRYFDGEDLIAEPKEEVVPPRRTNVFNNPLAGYADKLRAACQREGTGLREMTFLSGSTAINVLR